MNFNLKMREQVFAYIISQSYEKYGEFIYIYKSWHICNDKAVFQELLDHFDQETSLGIYKVLNRKIASESCSSPNAGNQ